MEKNDDHYPIDASINTICEVIIGNQDNDNDDVTDKIIISNDIVVCHDPNTKKVLFYYQPILNHWFLLAYKKSEPLYLWH